MQFGVCTFVETRRDPHTNEPGGVDKTFADLMEQMELADRVGLDVFGVGEHHRPDFAVSAPAVVLAAGASRTRRIRLTSAAAVLSSDATFGCQRYLMPMAVGAQSQAAILRSIELLGTVVAPAVRAELAKRKVPANPRIGSCASAARRK